MAENSESINELKGEIAGSRQRVANELRGLRYELDFPAKFRRSFRKQTGSWVSAAAAVGSGDRVGADAEEESLCGRKDSA